MRSGTSVLLIGPARLIALHEAAPVDDEPDELAQAREQVRRDETVSLAHARRELFGA